MGRLVRNFVDQYRAKCREKRRGVFLNYFSSRICSSTKILDLGSEDGSAICSVLEGLPYKPANVFIADIDAEAIRRGAEKYGFTPLLIPENAKIPVPDNYFDIVYSSSVIEHVTVDKEEIYLVRSQKEFEKRAWERQKAFANEVRRVGKSYFVQTPNRWFPIETHTWFPFVGWLNRPLQMKVIGFLNMFWIKKTAPDFHLLDEKKLRLLFPDADSFIPEISMGMVKSWMAVKITR